MAAIYAIGRWDARIAQESAELDQETDALLGQILQGRAFRDSIARLLTTLASTSDSLEVVDSLLSASLVTSREVAREEVAELARTPLDDLLPSLRMQAIRLPDPEPRIVYATDSAGARYLAGRLLRVAQLERELTSMADLASARAARLVVLGVAQDALAADRDTLQSQLDRAAPLLERWQDHNDCRILWLVPCPSRTTSLVIGLVAGGVAGVVLTRE